jgi:hypothetical protein
MHCGDGTQRWNDDDSTRWLHRRNLQSKKAMCAAGVMKMNNLEICPEKKKKRE